ncbi:MAG TPA: sigma-70 family RNA polymerase sigma factor [Acidimicrobiales bacterium]|nr:sigma-70 family RNA polymerase sigma factor [Acidimicrobiales bacterium]
MGDPDLLAQRFEGHRVRLRSVALRMLGSSHEADDAVQEAWLRLSRADAGSVDNLGGWLTTVVARVCLDVLRARASKPQVPMGSTEGPAAVSTPEDEALLADSLGVALLVVLNTLAPDERLAFVLHDMFAVPFDEIAPIVGRSPVAARQLASRARRRVQSDRVLPDASAVSQRQVVAAFLAASRQGDFAALLRLLDPEVVLRADAVAVDMAAQRAGVGAPALREQIRGADAVAKIFAGGARAARLTQVDGRPGAVVIIRGRAMAVFDFAVHEGRVVGIDLVADPETLEALELEPVAR